VSEPRSYGGWQPEKSGFIGRLSLAGFGFVAGAVGLLLVPVYSGSWPTLLVVLPAAAGLLALAYARVGGLAADEWLALAVRHAVNVARRRHVFLSGVFAPARADDPEQAQPMDLPGPLACLRILSAPTGAGTAGIVYDPLANTYAAVLRVRPPGLALADTDCQDRRVAGWGAVLAGLCVEAGPVVRVAVTERCLPDDGTALRSWTADHQTADAPAPAVAVLAELLERAGPAANQRDTFLTLTIDAGRARAKVKAAGGGQAGAAAVLLREVAALRPALQAAELQVVELLSPRGVAAAIRTAYDPHMAPALAARRTASADDPHATEAGVDPALAGPAAAHTSWGHYRHDGGFSVTYQARDWPRTAVYAGVLQPLMRPSETARRSFALICEPLGPRRAERELTRERTKRATLIALRRRTGRVDSPDEQAELSRSEAQDRARSAGHGVLRFTALLAVTVTDPADLDAACAAVEADAAMARLVLRRLWGAQDAGFAAAALPLGQGLPARRMPL